LDQSIRWGITLKVACAVLALLALSLSAASAEDDENIAMGAGVATCRQFNDLQKVDPAPVMLNFTAWAQGFMSSQNLNSYNATGTYRQLSDDIKLQQHFLVDFCNKFPNRLYSSAVAVLYETFPVRMRK
jgi:hypothetical protein